MNNLKSKLIRSGAGQYCAGLLFDSLDPIAKKIRHVAGVLGWTGLEINAFSFRVEWRERFEARVQSAAQADIDLSIACALNPVEGDVFDQVSAGQGIAAQPHAPAQGIVFRRLVNALTADEELAANLYQLQLLPVGRKALLARLAELRRGIEKHLADAVYGPWSEEDFAYGLRRGWSDPFREFGGFADDLPPLPEGYSLVGDADELSERLATPTELTSLQSADEDPHLRPQPKCPAANQRARRNQSLLW